MPSTTNLILIGGVLLFVFAGGVGLSKSAFAQGKEDFTRITGGFSKRFNEVIANNEEKKRLEKLNPTDRAGEMIV